MKKTLLLWLTLLSPLSMALGLGQATLHSKLGEELHLEIPILGAEDLNDDQIITTLGSNTDYQHFNIERSALHSDLKFELVRSGKETILLITSKRAVIEPFLQFPIQVTTAQKTLLRDIIVLVDPPKI